MATHYEPLLMTEDDKRALILKCFNLVKQYNTDANVRAKNDFASMPYTVSAVSDVEDTDNIVWDITVPYSASISSTRAYTTINKLRQGAKLTVNEGERACIVRTKAYLLSEKTSGVSGMSLTDTIDVWVLVGTSQNAITGHYRHTRYGSGDQAYPKAKGQQIQWDASYNISLIGNPQDGNQWANANNNLEESNLVLTKLSTASYFNRLSARGIIPSHITKFEIIRDHNSNYASDMHDTSWSFYAFMPSQESSNRDIIQIYAPEKFPEDMPIFDLDKCQASDIIAYLETGDKSKSTDPFDPENPPPKEIDDFKTNYELYISNVNDTTDKFTFYARNYQYNEFMNTFDGKYSLFVSSEQAGQTIENGLYHKDRLPTHGTPTLTDTFTIPTAGQYKYLTCYFGAYPTSSEEYVAGHYSAAWTVVLESKKSSTGVAIDHVEYHTSPGEESYSIVGRIALEGAYKYTNTATGESITIHLGSAPTMDDLGKPDDGYPGHDDDEDDSTGSDPTALVGRGFKTYRLSAEDFTTISNRFWGLTVFDGKVDPIQAIISSKSIPFSNTGSPADVVYVSSLEIEVGGASAVNQVKSYEMNTSLVIGPIRGDFTDIYYTRIHLYLPFIGWVELPASEVMSRQSKVAVGIEGATKRLNFKYIVDFISGDCRCVISVNGTERFFFDGNCGADAPLTYDNHVSAVEKQAAAVGSCVLSVAGMVGGAISGNPMLVGASAVAAVNTAPNVIPNYNYTWTASASGWIGQAMNRSIIVVVESPVVREPSGYGHKLGRPCERNLTLGTLGGFTKCKGADTSSINCTAEEHQMLEDLLNTGVYL